MTMKISAIAVFVAACTHPVLHVPGDIAPLHSFADEASLLQVHNKDLDETLNRQQMQAYQAKRVDLLGNQTFPWDAKAKVKKQCPIRMSERIAAVEWNWVVIRLLEAISFPPDTPIGFLLVKAEAQGTDCDAGFGSEMTKYEWAVQDETNNQIWERWGMVAFKKGSATNIKFSMDDVDLAFDNELAAGSFPIPPNTGDWGPVHEIGKGQAKLKLQMKFHDKPLVSHGNMMSMQSTWKEEIFHLKHGDTSKGADKASLVYVTQPKNTKAILYIPGRGDSFQHPHLLKVFLDRGFDLYTLDSRRCGRCRKYLDDWRLGHDSDDFDEYFEEINLALDIIKGHKDYTNLVGYMHSTGAPILLNYILKNGDDAFSSFIMNGPFLDWGWQGWAEGITSDPLLDSTSDLLDLGSKIVSLPPDIARMVKLWLNYRYDFYSNPLSPPPVTFSWAHAVTKVHDAIKDSFATGGVTQKPTFLICSEADDKLKNNVTVLRASFVSPTVAVRKLLHNSHDATISVEKELDDEALKIIGEFLVKCS